MKCGDNFPLNVNYICLIYSLQIFGIKILCVKQLCDFNQHLFYYKFQALKYLCFIINSIALYMQTHSWLINSPFLAYIVS